MQAYQKLGLRGPTKALAVLRTTWYHKHQENNAGSANLQVTVGAFLWLVLLLGARTLPGDEYNLLPSGLCASVTPCRGKASEPPAKLPDSQPPVPPSQRGLALTTGPLLRHTALHTPPASGLRAAAPPSSFSLSELCPFSVK